MLAVFRLIHLFNRRTNDSICAVLLHDKLFSATMTIFSKLIPVSTFVDTRVAIV